MGIVLALALDGFEGNNLTQMQFFFLARNAWSRAKPPIIIYGPNEEQSMEYLTEGCMINESKAKKLYKLAGSDSDRIVVLKSIADDFLAGQSFESRNALG